MEKLIYIAEFKEDANFGAKHFKKGDRYVINVDNTFNNEYVNPLPYKNQIWVMSQVTNYGINSYHVDRNLVNIKTEVRKAPFKPGDVVRHIDGKGDRHIPFVVASITWDRIDFWCQSGWGDSQNLANGHMASDLRLATEEEKVEFKSQIARDAKLFVDSINELFKIK